LQDNAGNTCLKAPDRDEQKYARDQAKRHLQPDDEIMPRKKEMKVKWITLDPVEQTDPRQAAKPNTDAPARHDAPLEEVAADSEDRETTELLAELAKLRRRDQKKTRTVSGGAQMTQVKTKEAEWPTRSTTSNHAHERSSRTSSSPCSANTS
jgi:hypothetical protein